jgi:hypothetical protein
MERQRDVLRHTKKHNPEVFFEQGLLLGMLSSQSPVTRNALIDEAIGAGMKIEELCTQAVRFQSMALLESLATRFAFDWATAKTTLAIAEKSPRRSSEFLEREHHEVTFQASKTIEACPTLLELAIAQTSPDFVKALMHAAPPLTLRPDLRIQGRPLNLRNFSIDMIPELPLTPLMVTLLHGKDEEARLIFATHPPQTPEEATEALVLAAHAFSQRLLPADWLVALEKAGGLLVPPPAHPAGKKGKPGKNSAPSGAALVRPGLGHIGFQSDTPFGAVVDRVLSGGYGTPESVNAMDADWFSDRLDSWLAGFAASEREALVDRMWDGQARSPDFPDAWDKAMEVLVRHRFGEVLHDEFPVQDALQEDINALFAHTRTTPVRALAVFRVHPDHPRLSAEALWASIAEAFDGDRRDTLRKKGGITRYESGALAVFLESAEELVNERELPAFQMAARQLVELVALFKTDGDLEDEALDMVLDTPPRSPRSGPRL